jgi:hypothetical protein
MGEAMPGGDQFISILEGMTMYEKYFTEEQRAGLAQRRAELGRHRRCQGHVCRSCRRRPGLPFAKYTRGRPWGPGSCTTVGRARFPVPQQRSDQSRSAEHVAGKQPGAERQAAMACRSAPRTSLVPPTGP